ncbi:MAG: M48 family metalloprotease [Acidobacteriota bacterium]|nr:M48 family metalloprotease [Acidobacteriota bacterium]
MMTGNSRAKVLLAVALALVATLAIGLAPAVSADRTRLQPGWDLFSPEQDIQIGKRLAAEVPKQMTLLNDPRVDNYLNEIGRTLVPHAPGFKYPYEYRCVNSAAINAFALPGGYIYINRGVIEAASTESELAGVMAHETAHVALRHGTSQASKAYIAEIPAALLSGWLGNNSGLGSAIVQMTTGFVMNSVFLKYSREDESQADVLGTQILYDSGYDPRALARFFEMIQAKSKSQPIEFFSDHPNPEHRVERVMEEVDKLGGPESGYKEDSRQFHEIQKYVDKLPPPPKKQTPQPQ